MRIYLAPIKGITDCIYRNTFGHYFKGVDLAVAPFITSVQSRKIKATYLQDILPEKNNNMALVPQILSNDPDDFLFIASRIFGLGWDEINWNLGCPTPMVANKHRGSGLLPDADRIRNFLDKVLAVYPDQISIKTRLGRNSSVELEKLLPIFDQYPLREIIIHPRLGVQMYKGSTDLEAFRRCLPLTKHKLVYNGDIIDQHSFSDLKSSFSMIDNWMIGRGLLANPFLAARIVEQGNPYLKCGEDRDILNNFHCDLFEQYQARLCGSSHLLGRMKGIWVYLAEVFENSAKIRKSINKIKRVEHYIEMINMFFETEPLVNTTH